MTSIAQPPRNSGKSPIGPERKSSVAVVHPRMGRGGSEAAAMWVLEALKRDYRVALIAGGSIDLDALNSFYGSSISPDECDLIEVPLPRPLAAAGWGDALRGAFALRAMRRHFDRFDVLINAYNLGDFGRPAIHLLADFSWDEDLRYSLHPAPGGMRRIAHAVEPIRRAYLATCRALAGASRTPVSQGAGLVIANSEWSRRKLRDRYGIDSRVIHPPVAIAPVAKSAVRHSRFVVIGRISPEKRIERTVAILRAVRARGHDVSLHIIGDVQRDAYARNLGRMCRSEGRWIVLEGAQFGERKARILTESAFGVHACEGESFGIAVAEMVRAGCIAFASAEGGPAEILDHRALLFHNENEAVEKICAVLESDPVRTELRAHLQRQAEKFSRENFVTAIRETVAEFCGRPTVPTAARRSKEAFEC